MKVILGVKFGSMRKEKEKAEKLKKLKKWAGLGSDLWAASHCKASVSHKHEY